MRDRTKSEMFSFLTSVTSAKNLTGQDMRTWVLEVHTKLQVLEITTVKATVSWIYTLNAELRLNGLQTMHRQTLDLMARNGVALLLQEPPEPLPSSNLIVEGPGVELPPESSSESGEESDYSNSFEPDGGHCSECNGPGTIGESCPNCEAEGGVYLNFHAGL